MLGASDSYKYLLLCDLPENALHDQKTLHANTIISNQMFSCFRISLDLSKPDSVTTNRVPPTIFSSLNFPMCTNT